MNERGRSQSRYCIAHIWCWPTPVVQTTSSRLGGELLQRLEDELRLECVAVCGVAERELLAPGGELAQPWLGPGHGGPGSVECAQLVREVGKHLLQGADHGDIRLAELRDLSGVDVEMDDRCTRRERRELPRDAVVEACADGNQEIALVHRPVRPLRPVHPGPAEVELVGFRERALAHQRRHDRKAPDLGEGAELVACFCVERSAAHVEDGLLRGRERVGGARDLARMPLLRRLPAGQVDRVGVLEVEHRLLHVARDVHEDRPAAAGAGDVERGLHDVRELVDVLDEPRVLDDRDRDAGDVALLERVRADQVRAHLAGDADERRRVHPRVGDRGDEVRRARAGRRDRDADPSRRARVALRHVPCALLVAGEDVTHGRPARERVVGREDGAAGKPEGDVDPLGLERAEDRVGAVHSHATASR